MGADSMRLRGERKAGAAVISHQRATVLLRCCPRRCLLPHEYRPTYISRRREPKLSESEEAKASGSPVRTEPDAEYKKVMEDWTAMTESPILASPNFVACARWQVREVS